MRVLLVLVILLFQCYEAKTPEKEKQATQIKNTLIGDEEWKIISYATNPDSLNVRVTYQEKYGSEKTILCKAVFMNEKSQQYKLVSPSSAVILEKSNIVSISYNQIPIERGNQ